ncbi:hypothetical protein [Nocardioides sp. T2.26MG-1]|uniref:hypothetical protein n=1 Tax=Nocardioides sp. T2.26MG-1 TaxID=3041166 RepID=UPI00253FECA2|nr:hypothetical protein [Nocardioides sp. T2.26MG-1]
MNARMSMTSPVADDAQVVDAGIWKQPLSSVVAVPRRVALADWPTFILDTSGSTYSSIAAPESGFEPLPTNPDTADASRAHAAAAAVALDGSAAVAANESVRRVAAPAAVYRWARRTLR